MSDRLKDKSAIVVGAGSIGPGWGNGKATAVAFAREGAKLLCVDMNLDAALETAGLIAEEGGGQTAESAALRSVQVRQPASGRDRPCRGGALVSDLSLNDQSSKATARVHPPEPRFTLCGKQATRKPLAGSSSRLHSFSMWQYGISRPA
jgi:NAD(P)-dependent dehydrogenase (short-subunit alcohol dehydrogenase family)